jgi:ATP-dependent RNA helicase RhlE
VNFDLPNVPETYVHRIGRTGRAGAEGIAVSFCDHEERQHLRDIESMLRKKTPVCDDHPEYATAAASGQTAERSQSANDRPARSKQGGPPPRKPHGAGPADGRHRSRRRKIFSGGQLKPSSAKRDVVS